MSDLTLIPLSKHQDHVVKHVLGCVILGVYYQPGHIHFLLDIPFLWSADADGAMSLVQDVEAVNEFLEPPEKLNELVADIQTLHESRFSVESIRHFHPPIAIGTIREVDLYQHQNGKDLRLIIIGDEDKMIVELRPSQNVIEIS